MVSNENSNVDIENNDLESIPHASEINSIDIDGNIPTTNVIISYSPNNENSIQIPIATIYTVTHPYLKEKYYDLLYIKINFFINSITVLIIVYLDKLLFYSIFSIFYIYFIFLFRNKSNVVKNSKNLLIFSKYYIFFYISRIIFSSYVKYDPLNYTILFISSGLDLISLILLSNLSLTLKKINRLSIRV